MTWNYRVCKERVPTGSGDLTYEWYSIREVYYDADGNPVAWTANPVAATGDTPTECADAAARMAGCLALGVLDLDALDEKSRGE